MDIASLIAPCSVADFRNDYFERAPYLANGVGRNFGGLLGQGDWRDALLGSQQIFASRVDDGQQVSRPVTVSQALADSATHTICADVGHREEVAAFLSEFERSLSISGGEAIAKMYVSPQGAGFAVHSDAFHVFVLQIAGMKRWTVSRSHTDPAPVTGWTLDANGHPHPELPRGFDPALLEHAVAPKAPTDDMFECVLEPGDCLYVPAGAWHRAAAIGESVAISISPPRASALRFFYSALERTLLSNPDFRRDLLAWPGESQEAGRFDAMLGKFRAAVTELESSTVVREWFSDLERARPTTVVPDSTTAVEDSQHLGLAPGARLVCAPDQDRVQRLYVFAAGEEWCLPIELHEFVSKNSFLVANARARAPELNVLELLEELISAGVLTRRSFP